jgi:hypothetical protein
VTPWDEVRFWAQVIQDRRRTILCPPDLESRVKGMVDAYGAAGTYDVQASPLVPDDQIFVVDQRGLEAAGNQALQRALHNWRY